jgi:agmatinase
MAARSALRRRVYVRSLPGTRDLSQADVAIVGVPMDMAVMYRSGARFGPRAIRDGSGGLRPHGLTTDELEEPFASLRVIDYGDLTVIPGYIEDSAVKIQAEIAPIVEAGVFPLVLGGDHSTTLPVLRAVAAKHGTLSLVHFDAHPDFWPLRTTGCITVPCSGRRSKRLIDPRPRCRSAFAGRSRRDHRGDARGGLSPSQRGSSRTRACGRRSRTYSGVQPARVRLADIDSVDPAYAPGTGRRRSRG